MVGIEAGFGAVGEDHLEEAEEAQEVRPAMVYNSAEKHTNMFQAGSVIVAVEAAAEAGVERPEEVDGEEHAVEEEGLAQRVG